MEPKKNPNVDLEKKRGLYIQIGLALALLLVLGAFEYRSYEKGISSLGDFDMEADWEEEIENTFREEKPPPHHLRHQMKLSLLRTKRKLKKKYKLKILNRTKILRLRKKRKRPPMKCF